MQYTHIRTYTYTRRIHYEFVYYINIINLISYDQYYYNYKY